MRCGDLKLSMNRYNLRNARIEEIERKKDVRLLFWSAVFGGLRERLQMQWNPHDSLKYLSILWI